MTVRVLIVCTANICRSPASAVLLDSGTGPGVEVVSAGTRARSGDRACPVATDWAGEFVPSSGSTDVREVLTRHRSRPLSAELVAAADLVLTMSRRHRSAVVALVPQAQRRTFPIRYVERLAPSLILAPDRPADQEGRGLWLASELHVRRAESGFVEDPDDTVPDPHRTGDHPPALSMLGSAVRSVLGILTGP